MRPMGEDQPGSRPGRIVSFAQRLTVGAVLFPWKGFVKLDKCRNLSAIAVLPGPGFKLLCTSRGRFQWDLIVTLWSHCHARSIIIRRFWHVLVVGDAFFPTEPGEWMSYFLSDFTRVKNLLWPATAILENWTANGRVPTFGPKETGACPTLPTLQGRSESLWLM